MVTFDKFRELALSFPETTQEPHFEKTSFRVRKKIFATFDEKNNRATIKLSDIDQEVFSSLNRSIIYPVGNKWGIQGWTIIELDNVNLNILIDALTTAFCEVAPKKIAEQIKYQI